MGERGRSWPVTAPAQTRIYEITGTAAWAELVSRYPLDVTHARGADWRRATGRDGAWQLPDWIAVARDYDAVHLTVAGYLIGAGSVIALDHTHATLIAGWNPDETYWLTNVTLGPPTDWTAHEHTTGTRIPAADGLATETHHSERPPADPAVGQVNLSPLGAGRPPAARQRRHAWADRKCGVRRSRLLRFTVMIDPMSHSAPGGPNLRPLLERPTRQWPEVAHDWLDEGFASPQLTDFAALTPAEAVILFEEMANVLASLGVEVDTDRELLPQLVRLSGFEEACQRAAAAVAADLEKTWRPTPVGVVIDDFDCHPDLSAHVVLGDARLQSPTGGLPLGMNNVDLLIDAADQVSHTLLSIAGWEWPYCHRHRHRAHAELATTGATAVWSCRGSSHILAKIGSLTARDADAHEMWWAQASGHDPMRPTG